MKRLLALVVVSTVIVSMMGCATTDNLRVETAKAIGENVTAPQVTLSDIQRGFTEVTWQASAPAGTYRCSTDVMVYVVFCFTNSLAGSPVQDSSSAGSSAGPSPQ
jgi:hypothetical protein